MTSSDDNESADSDEDPSVDDQDEDKENEDEGNEDQDEENEQEEENEEEIASDDQEKSDSSSDDDSSSDEDDDESKEERKVAAATTEDGHQLSAYELQRLERIRRNKEYLASLGLEKNKPRPQKTQPARRKRETVKPARRSSLGRRTKAKPISYSENPTPRWQETMPGDTGESATQAVAPAAPVRPTKALPRMERFIYDEFKRIRTEVKQSLKTAERNMREADIAYRYAKKGAERYELEQKRQNEYKRLLQDMERERNGLGCTAREMLIKVDSRMYEIESALRTFDQRFRQHAYYAQWAEQQAENARKMEIIDAMDRFPKALKDAMSDLDLLLLERAPRDPPPPRRGTRKRDSSAVDEPEQDAKKRAIESPDSSKERLADGSWGSLAAAITAETLSTSAQVRREKSSPEAVLDLTDSQSTAPAKLKKKKREGIPKIVGGWVSPAFAQAIDRSWLETDDPPKKFDVAKYIPQIGDTVVYYPSGHRAFLNVHPDILGKKTRNISRFTLWHRAKREKAKLEKAALEDAETKHSQQESVVNTLEGAEKKEAPQEPVDKTSTWWNDEWLASVEEDLGRYPIVCRVEKTHVEFPPDPYAESKIITKDDQSGGVQVTFACRKDSQKKKQANPPLCLAVMLRPLTPVLPPSLGKAEARADQELALAPNFYVVTFPSKVSPFILPFSLAYRSSHSLSTGLAIRLASKPEWRGKVMNFRSFDGDYGSGRLDDKIDAVRALCSALKSGPNSFAKSLEDALYSDTRASIPITDACTVIERFETLLEAGGAETLDSNDLSTAIGRIGMMELIRSTLPLWKEVIVESGVGKKVASSAWELLPIEAKTNTHSGPLNSLSADVEIETGLVYILDEPLRAKIEFTIEDFLKDTPDSSMFRPLVSDEIAPSYSCAVPLGMAFDKILRRLKVRKQSKDGVSRCYYRTVDSLLSDISAIADNCVLYNSPDSYVVEKAIEIAPTLKRLITQVASSHFKEKETREKAVEQRRQAILSQVNAPALVGGENELNESTPRSRGAAKREALQAPYIEPLYRSWIQDSQPDGSWTRARDPSTPGARSMPSLTSESSAERTTIGEIPQLGQWVPQSGDTILYSRALHSDFVKGHHPSLLTEQCLLPRFVGEGDSMKQSSVPDEGEATENTASSDSVQNRWLVGKVVWVRAFFPRAPSRRDTDYENTFEVASPILAIGIRFNYSWASKKIHTVYWRPCAFCNNSTDTDTSALSTSSLQQIGNSKTFTNDDESRKTVSCEKCAACHLKIDQSFVRPAWLPVDDLVLPGEDEDHQTSQYLMPDGPLSSDYLFVHPKGLSDEAISSIDRCLNTLKRRCLADIPPDYVDPKFSKESVKKGWAPAAKSGKKLPTFERLLEKGNSNGNEGATRGIEKVDMDAVALLADSHYLPPWTSSLSEGSSKKTNRDGIAQSLSLHQTLSPNPNLCLELIQQRLRNGFYRNRSGLAHDIEEAYIASVLLVLSKPAAAKKGKTVSMRRIAKALSCQATLSLPKAGDKKRTKIHALSEDEMMWVGKIKRVRKLYVTALVCVTETECMDRMFGTVLKKKTAVAKGNETVDEREQIFKEARHRLGFIVSALQRDPCSNRAWQASINPAVRVKVRFTGQDAFPKEMQNGSHSVCNDVVDTTKPILFEHKDYENNDALVKVFFGRPGRMAACARCRAYGRSTIVCRLYKRHILPDFDWILAFHRSGGIEGLLYMLRTGLPAVKSSSQPPALLNDNAATGDAEGPNMEKGKPNPTAVFEKAKAAIVLAKRLLEQARKKAQAPIRLREEFIRSYFPVDPSDGHYNYCTICGLSGDVVCCEGCPNVIHPHCVGLSDIPEDDWYCSKCTLKSKETGGASATDSSAKKEGYATSAQPQKPPASSNQAAACDETLLVSGVEKEDNETSSESQKPLAVSNQTAASDEVLLVSGVEKEDSETRAQLQKPPSVSNLTAAIDETLAAPSVGNDDYETSAKSRKPPGLPNQSASSRGDEVSAVSVSVTNSNENDDDTARLEGILNELKSLRPKRPSKPAKKRGMGGDQKHEMVDDEEDNNIDPHEDDNDDASTKSLTVEIGTKFMKSFGIHGEYAGTVLELPTSDQPFYRVRYEDGDEEDMEEDELKSLLERERRRQKRKRDAADEPKPGNAVKRLHGCPPVAEPAPLAKRGRGRPPKRKDAEVAVPASAKKRGQGSPSKRNAVEVPAQQKRKPRTCKVENCPDPNNCPGTSNRDWCLSFGDETEGVAKRRGTSSGNRKKRKTRTCKVENCPDPKACPGKSNRERCLGFMEDEDTVPEEQTLEESSPKKPGLRPSELSVKKRGASSRT